MLVLFGFVFVLFAEQNSTLAISKDSNLSNLEIKFDKNETYKNSFKFDKNLSFKPEKKLVYDRFEDSDKLLDDQHRPWLCKSKSTEKQQDNISNFIDNVGVVFNYSYSFDSGKNGFDFDFKNRDCY